MKGLLKLFFILLIVAFLVGLTVFLVLFAQGKKITPRGTIVDTSVLRIEMIPEDSAVYVNGVLVDVSDNRVQGIDIGTVQIRVEAEGYTTWEKEIVLENNRVETIYPVLIPFDPAINILSSENINTIITSDDGNYIYYTTVDLNNLVTVKRFKISSGLLDFNEADEAELVGSFNLDTSNSFELIESSNEIDQQNNVSDSAVETQDTVILPIQELTYSLDISPDNEKILVKAPSLNEIYLIDSTESAENTSIKEILGFIPEGISWFGDSNRLIVQDKGLLYEYDLLTNNKNIIYYNPEIAPIYTISSNTIYFYNSLSNSLNVYKNGREEVLTLPEGVELSENITKLLSSSLNSNVLVAISDNNIFYYDIENGFSDVITDTSAVVAISTTADKLLLKNDTILSLYEVKEKNNNERLAIKSILTTNLLESDQYAFTINGAHLFNITLNPNNSYNVSLLDADGENEFNILENINSSQSFVFLDRRNEDIYYTSGNDLLKIQLEVE